MSKFSFLPNFVNSVHRGMYNTSKKSYVQELDFIFLHLRALSNLWGRYDPKTEKTDIFGCNCVICHGSTWPNGNQFSSDH